MNLDLGGIIAGAVGGGAEAAGGVAQGYIDNNRKSALAQQLSDMEEQKQLRMAQAGANLTRDTAAQERTRVQGIINPATANLPADATSSARYAAIRDAGMAAGDMGVAANADKIMDTGMKVIPAYGSLAQDGKIVASNDGTDKTNALIAVAEARMKAKLEGQGSKMPEDAKIQLQGLERQDAAITARLDKAMADPLYKEDSPIALRLQAEANSVKMQRMGIYAKHGLIDGADDATRLLQSETNPEVLKQAVQRAYNLDRTKYGPAFEQVVRDSGKLPRAAPAAAPGATADPAAGPPKVDDAVPAIHQTRGAQAIENTATDSSLAAKQFANMGNIALMAQAHNNAVSEATRNAAVREIQRRRQLDWDAAAASRANATVESGD